MAAYGQHPSIVGANWIEDKRKAARLIVSPDLLAGEVPPTDAVAFVDNSDAWANKTAFPPQALTTLIYGLVVLAEQDKPFWGIAGQTPSTPSLRANDPIFKNGEPVDITWLAHPG